MQRENDRLKIHTAVRPEPSAAKQVETPDEPPKAPTQRTRPKRRRREQGDRMTVGERLLRNTAVACALLLTAMSIRNVDQPWSRRAAEGIRQAMTMRVDWDDTLGKLSFVRALVPDTALVFLNMGSSLELSAPVDGDLTHEFTAQQPWLEYRCAAEQAVRAAMSGVVKAVGQGAGDEWTVLIEGEDGAETVYGYLADAYVKAGQSVNAGDSIGVTEKQADGRMYFELREGGEAVDPSGRMRP